MALLFNFFKKGGAKTLAKAAASAATTSSITKPVTLKFKDKKKKKKEDPKTVYNYTPATGTDYSSLASSGGGGYSGGYSSSASRVPDISGLLAAYDQQADASRKIAQNAYNTTRNDLLTSLKRFQEQNAKDVENQKQGYLAEQSSLDYAREQANRQNRVSASARGLGGSGLQQLAQLQTLMSQGEDISNAAASNQKAMDALRQALQQKEDDTNTQIAKARTTLSDTLSQIEANLAKQKAETIYQNEMAKASGGSGGGSGSSGDSENGFNANLANILDSYNAELGSLAGKSDKAVKDYVTTQYGEKYGTPKTMSDVRTILGRAYIDDVGNYFTNKTSNATYNATNNTIASMVNSLKGQGSKAAKKAAKKTTKKKKK